MHVEQAQEDPHAPRDRRSTRGGQARRFPSPFRPPGSIIHRRQIDATAAGRGKNATTQIQTIRNGVASSHQTQFAAVARRRGSARRTRSLEILLWQSTWSSRATSRPVAPESQRRYSMGSVGGYIDAHASKFRPQRTSPTNKIGPRLCGPKICHAAESLAERTPVRSSVAAVLPAYHSRRMPACQP